MVASTVKNGKDRLRKGNSRGRHAGAHPDGIHPSLPITPIFPSYFIGSYKTPIIGQQLLYFL